MDADALSTAQQHLKRIVATSVELDLALAEGHGLLGPDDGRALASELGRLACRLEGLAEAAGLAADPSRIA